MITAAEMREITKNNGDELEQKFKEKVEYFEKRIRDAALEGRSEIFFEYTQGRTPFGNPQLYARLKNYFISNGFKIIKYDTTYSCSTGMMCEYAKEHISW